MALGSENTETGFKEVFLPKERWSDYACFKKLLACYEDSPFYDEFDPMKLGRYLSDIILLEPEFDQDHNLIDFKFILQGENTKPLYGNIALTKGFDMAGPIFRRTLSVLEELLKMNQPLLTQIERISIDKFYFKVGVLYVPFLNSERQISKIICQLNIKQHDL